MYIGKKKNGFRRFISESFSLQRLYGAASPFFRRRFIQTPCSKASQAESLLHVIPVRCVPV